MDYTPDQALTAEQKDSGDDPREWRTGYSCSMVERTSQDGKVSSCRSSIGALPDERAREHGH